MTCEQCDAQVREGDSFCGECGAFLDWSASPSASPKTPAAPAPPPDPPPAAPPPPPSPPAAPPPPPAAKAEPEAPEPEPDGPEPDAGKPDAERPGAEGSSTGGPEAAGDVPGADSARAAALLAPTPPGSPPRPRRPDRPRPEPAAPPPPAGPGPVAVQPGRGAVPRPRVRAAADDYTGSADDLGCPACGTPNPAGRAFCRRCGARLAPERPAARPPWWRRLRWRRAPHRRGPAGRFRRPLARLVLLLALAALVVAAIAYGPSAVDALRDRFGEPATVRPEEVRASSSAPGQPADLAVDGTTNRFWAPAADRAPEGEWLEASFASPFRLSELILHSGGSERAAEFLTRARPATLIVTGWDADGEQVGSRTVTLQDQPGEQVVRLTMDGVVTLRLTIDGVYGARGQEPSRLVALGEVEFFRRS